MGPIFGTRPISRIASSGVALHARPSAASPLLLVVLSLLLPAVIGIESPPLSAAIGIDCGVRHSVSSEFESIQARPSLARPRERACQLGGASDGAMPEPSPHCLAWPCTVCKRDVCSYMLSPSWVIAAWTTHHHIIGIYFFPFCLFLFLALCESTQNIVPGVKQAIWLIYPRCCPLARTRRIVSWARREVGLRPTALPAAPPGTVLFANMMDTAPPSHICL